MLNDSAILKKLIDEGMNSQSIADELDVSRSAVNRACVKFGLQKPGRGELAHLLKSVRKVVFEMQPLDAINYLLDILENVVPGQSVSEISDFHTNLPFRLTGSEARLLFSLYKARGRMLSKDRLMNELYLHCHADEDFPNMKIIDVFVCKLRNKLKKSGLPIEIITYWGIGYGLSEKSRFPWEST